MNISELSSAICQRLNHINQKTPEENVIIEYGMTLSMLFIWGLSLTASRYVTIGIPALVCIFIIGIAAVLLWVPQSINIGYFTSEDIARKKVYSFLFLCCSLIVAVLFGSIRMLIVSPIILEILTLIPNHNNLERSGKNEETTC